MLRVFSRPACVCWFLAAVAAHCGTLAAGLIAFTDRAAFEAALPAPAATLTFDSLAAGTLIGEGDTLGGITFDYDLFTSFGVSMQVRNDFDTASPPNYLGTDDLGLFQDGDSFGLALAPSFAIGLTLLTADPLFDDDFVLTVAGTSVGLDASAVQQSFADGSQAFFLGIIDDVNPFTSASLTADGGPGGPFFLYSVDDIITAPAVAAAVPEPASVLLLGVGAAGLIRWRRRTGPCRRREHPAGAAGRGG